MKVENLKTGSVYNFIPTDWIEVTDKLDGWTELPTQQATDTDTLPG